MKLALILVIVSTAGCASLSALTFQDDLEQHAGQRIAVSGTLLVNGERIVLCPPTVSEDDVGCLTVRLAESGQAISVLHTTCVTVSGTLHSPEQHSSNAARGSAGVFGKRAWSPAMWANNSSQPTPLLRTSQFRP